MSEVSPRRKNGPVFVVGARGLFRYHVALFSWWALVQAYFRVFARVPRGDAALPIALGSWALVCTSAVVTTRFALGRRGTRAETVARLAMVLALFDLVCETMQLAPELGLPALIPNGKDRLELLVRGVWASAEFTLRSAVFVSLWRSQLGASRRWCGAFFTLVGAHWVIAMLAFASSTQPYADYWSSLRLVPWALKTSPLFGFAWLFILVWLSHRVATEGRSAAPQE